MKSMTDAMFNGTKWISKNNSYEEALEKGLMEALHKIK